MQKVKRTSWMLLTGWLSLCGTVFAEPPAAGEPARLAPEQLKNTSPEERRAEQEKMREQWQSMTPEQRSAKREEIRRQWESLPLNEREALRQKIRAGRAGNAGPSLPPAEGSRPQQPGLGAGPGSMTPPQRTLLRERWQRMSPEERETLKQKFRERVQNMPPEERAAKRQELRERWQRMSPEERQRMRRDFEQAGHQEAEPGTTPR